MPDRTLILLHRGHKGEVEEGYNDDGWKTEPQRRLTGWYKMKTRGKLG